AARYPPKQFATGAGDEGPDQHFHGQRKARRLALNRRLEPPRERSLRILAQLVHLRHAVYAPHGAERRAVLHAVILAPQVVGAVLLKWDTRMTALLRAPVDQAILADIEVPRAGAAEPVVWLSVGKVLLEAVVVREVEHRLSERHDPLQNQPLRLAPRARPAAAALDRS